MKPAMEYRLRAAYAEARSNVGARANRNKWRCLADTYLQLAEQIDAGTRNDRNMHDPVWGLLDSASRNKAKDAA